MIAWELSDGGHSLDIFEVNPVTRELVLILPLKMSKAMTKEEALKYVNANYPREGTAVSKAAEALGMRKKP